MIINVLHQPENEKALDIVERDQQWFAAAPRVEAVRRIREEAVVAGRRISLGDACRVVDFVRGGGDVWAARHPELASAERRLGRARLSIAHAIEIMQAVANCNEVPEDLRAAAVEYTVFHSAWEDDEASAWRDAPAWANLRKNA